MDDVDDDHHQEHGARFITTPCPRCRETTRLGDAYPCTLDDRALAAAIATRRRRLERRRTRYDVCALLEEPSAYDAADRTGAVPPTAEGGARGRGALLGSRGQSLRPHDSLRHPQ